MTTRKPAAAMLAAIVGLLKDDAGAWRDNVSGADFIQEVSVIIDAPPVEDDAAGILRSLVTSEVYAEAASVSPWLRAQRERVAALGLLGVPSVPAPHWWIVTLRESGDDEDELIMLQAPDEPAAVDGARAQLMEARYDGAACEACGLYPCGETCGACDYPKPDLYVNHVVDCGTTQPIHVRTAP